MGRIARGWDLSKKSFGLVEHDRRLLLFPLLSLVATLVAAVIIFVPLFAWEGAGGGDWPYVAGFVVGAWAFNFIGTFFGVAFIAVARRALDGEEWSMGSGWRCARARIGAIALWSLVSTLVGLLLQALERVRGGVLVNVVARWIVGAAWSLATFFVLPVIALEGTGPVAATKRSVAVVRKRWGEGVTGATAIGGIFLIVFLAAIPPAVLGFVTLAGAPYVGIPLLVVAVTIFVGGMVVNTAVSQLFRFVLYEYAVSDRVLGPFDASELDAAFKPRRRLFGRF